MKRLLFFICTLLCANVILAQGFSEGGLHYYITGAGEVEVCGGTSTSVNIPSSVTHTWKHYSSSCNCYITDSVRTYSVTSIEQEAFRDCSSLTSVTIPNSVTSIGGGAFRDCSSLTSVTIGNSVTSIGGGAFEDCSSLTSVDIPNSVTSIERGAFEDCSSLASVTIGNSVTSIEDEAFYGCSSLTTLNYNAINCNGFYYNYYYYGGYGLQFENCPITTINIGNSVQRIPDFFAYELDSLTSVTIPNSVTSIGEWAFAYCHSLTSVTIPNSVTSIGEGAFCECYYLTSVTIPNSVTSIGDYAFYDCSSLTSVTIPNSVTSIGEDAFWYCSSLTSVTCLATNPPELGDHSFYSNITDYFTLYVPNGCRESYQNSDWAHYFDCIVELGSNNSIAELDVEVNNEEWGSVEVNEGCGTATLTAVVEEDCSEFLRWSDGNTDNPRVVNVASDTSFTAIFKDPVLDTTINATIMQGETYNFNGQELSEEGVYNATVLSVLGCEINLTVNLDVIPNDYTNGETSSLQETEVEEIVFYPNPTKGLISFSKTIERIEVVDISGKILLSFSNVREINIGDLPAGSYLLRLHSNENSVLRKIVKE